MVQCACMRLQTKPNGFPHCRALKFFTGKENPKCCVPLSEDSTDLARSEDDVALHIAHDRTKLLFFQSSLRCVMAVVQERSQHNLRDLISAALKLSYTMY